MLLLLEDLHLVYLVPVFFHLELLQELADLNLPPVVTECTLIAADCTAASGRDPYLACVGSHLGEHHRRSVGYPGACPVSCGPRLLETVARLRSFLI